MKNYRRYTEYKDSGIEWLGEIPEYWEITAIKRFGDVQGGSGFPDVEQGFANEKIPFFKVSDMNLQANAVEMVKSANTVSRNAARRLRAFVFPPNTIIFPKVGAALMTNKRRILTKPSCVDNKEYRTALISAAVTGKIDVREEIGQSIGEC